MQCIVTLLCFAWCLSIGHCVSCKNMRVVYLGDWVICHLALIKCIHQCQHPCDVEGQLLRKEVVCNGVHPFDVGHMPQVHCQPVKVSCNGAALPGSTTKECYGFSVCAEPGVHIPAAARMLSAPEPLQTVCVKCIFSL